MIAVSQLYIVCNKNGKIIIVMENIRGDLLKSGSVRLVSRFVAQGSPFQIRKVIIYIKFNFSRCDVYQDTFGDVIPLMEMYVSAIKFIPLSQ